MSSAEHASVVAALNYDFAYRYNVIELESKIVDVAQRLANDHPLRAYDAVHLASAWLANQALVQAGRSALMFICADDRLVSIAQAEGLPAENPNRYA